MRLYKAPGRTPIWIYVGVYAGRAGHAAGAHDPEVCYPAFGWEVLASRFVEIPLDALDRMHATLLMVHNDNRAETVLYWFQPAGRWSAPGAVDSYLGRGRGATAVRFRSPLRTLGKRPHRRA